MNGGFDGAGDWMGRASTSRLAPMPALARAPEILVGERVIYLTQRPTEPSAEALPRARAKLITSDLSDQSKLVTLVVNHSNEAPDVETLNIVSTEPGGAGTVLAQGYGRRDQPTILVFKLSD